MFQTSKAASSLPIITNGLLVALKLSVGLVIGSISVVSDGLDTTIDMVSAFIAFVSIRIASRPADQEHPYGHGRAENLSGVVESFFIIAGGIFITYEAIRRLFADADLRLVELGIGVMAFSVAVNLLVSWHLLRVASRTGSPALAAAAKHRATDVLTSLGILLGLVAVKLTGFGLLDPILALVVAAIVFWTAIQILRSSFSVLMDVSLPEEEERGVYDLVARYSNWATLRHLHTRKAGTKRFFDLTLATCRELTVRTAHDLSDRIEADIAEAHPGSQINIHVEPCTEESDAPCPVTCSMKRTGAAPPASGFVDKTDAPRSRSTSQSGP